MDFFDYQYYLEQNPDIRNMNAVDAYGHYNNFGRHENRICKRTPINDITNITIALHLFKTNLWDEMTTYINNVKRVFSRVHILVTIPIDHPIETTIKKQYTDAIVIPVENRGVDVLPFIISVQYIRKHNIPTDFILKMHTKITGNTRDKLYNWRQELLAPITDYDNLLILQQLFQRVDNIGCVQAQKCCVPKTIDSEYKYNLLGIRHICKTFPHVEESWSDFNAGNMFWINNDVLNEYLTEPLIEFLVPKFREGKPPCNFTGPYVEYICERLFTGNFCFKKKNILINEYPVCERALFFSQTPACYQPKVFSIYKPEEQIHLTGSFSEPKV